MWQRQYAQCNRHAAQCAAKCMCHHLRISKRRHGQPCIVSRTQQYRPGSHCGPAGAGGGAPHDRHNQASQTQHPQAQSRSQSNNKCAVQCMQVIQCISLIISAVEPAMHVPENTGELNAMTPFFLGHPLRGWPRQLCLWHRRCLGWRLRRWPRRRWRRACGGWCWRH